MATQEIMPPEEAASLAAINEAKLAIQVALANEDVEGLLELRDQVAAAQHYWRKREEARDLYNNAGELKVRAEAALGRIDLVAAPNPRGGPRRKATEEEGEGNGDGTAEVTPPQPAPLADFQPNRRSMFRTLGRLDDDQLDSVVVKLREEEGEGGVTTARAVRVAKEVLPTEERATPSPSKESRKEIVTDYVAHLRALDTETSTLVRMARKVIPASTSSERGRMAARLGATITRLDDLREGLEVEGAEPAGEAEAEE